MIKLKGQTRKEVEKEKEALEALRIRRERNKKLQETDWMFLQDSPVPEEVKHVYATYRQALRNVPQQAEFPTKVVWPEKPVVTGEHINKAQEDMYGFYKTER